MQAKSFVNLLKSAGALVLLFIAGCGGGSGTLNPQFQPQVTNAQDSFQLQATNVTGVTQTLPYQWQTTGTAASINQATTVTAGTATLTIADVNNKVVYTNSLAANGTFTSAAGAGPGTWTITVALNNYSGTLNFRVQKM